jgi:radical SAM superfamily enzyme YgiQ (UPF0313 family)
MRILLYVPDNHVTRNFVPQLWPFLLRQRTPSGHDVSIIDGNVDRLSIPELVGWVQDHRIDLVGMGFMTRMARKAYDAAIAIRTQTGVPVVFGGPHVTSLPDEALGRTGLPRSADAVVLGEADETWAEVVEDAARGSLKEVYGPDGHGVKPTLEGYAPIDWESLDLSRFDLMRFVPDPVRRLFRKLRIPYDKGYVVPVETSRGCPYGCEFCTVTGFFGRKIRSRSNDSVIAELLALKRIAARTRALVSVFFIDDNFAIQRERLKSLLVEMIRQDACLPWIAQISVNLLDDEELVDLIARSGGRFIFMGLESVDHESLRATHKGFNKPEEYARTLDRLSRHNVHAVTSFIVGLDGDRPGGGARVASEVATWPPVLPVFGLLTPYPATPLYERLEKQGRLLRPKHWLDVVAFKGTFQFSHMSVDEAEGEVRAAWRECYRPRSFARTQRWLVANGKAFDVQAMFLVARLLFRGIYFPQPNAWSWIRLIGANSPTIAHLVLRRLLRRASAQPVVVPSKVDPVDIFQGREPDE